MENNVTVFEQKHMMAMLELRNLANDIKAKQDRFEAIKDILIVGMDENNIVSINNEYVTISRIDATPGKPKLDEKAWRADDPEGYNKVFQKYNKMAGAKKAFIRITTK